MRHLQIYGTSKFIAQKAGSHKRERVGSHKRERVVILVKKSLTPFTKDAKLNPCDNCLFGKHHRVVFYSSSKRQSELLSIVYSDICGPIEVESLGGRKYFLTFIDDASQKVWVYGPKTKAEVF